MIRGDLDGCGRGRGTFLGGIWMREDQQARHWRILCGLDGKRVGVTVRDLAEALDCSERTIYRDIRALEAAGFPILTERDGGPVRYRFIDDFKLGATLELSADELMALYFSRGLLESFEGTLFEGSIGSLVDKVMSRVPRQSAEHFEGLAASVAAGRGPRRDYAGKSRIMATIIEASKAGRTARIRYFAASSGQTLDREVEPYKLWCQGDAFYVIGHCHLRDEVRTFLVDRIESAEIGERSFEVPADFDFERYVSDSFRVFKDGEVRKVVIRFDNRVAHCFRERKWHPSQEFEVQDDGSVQVTMLAEGLEEICSWVLGWGSLALVLEPPELRDRVARIVGELYDRYRGD